MEEKKELSDDKQPLSATAASDGNAISDVDKELEVGEVSDAIDHKTEKKLVRKIDLYLITLFGALYLMSFLGLLHSALARIEEVLLTK
jgi:hypothetical protein